MINPTQIGFVLQHTQMTTSRRIITLFSKDLGKCRGVYRVSKKQPLAYLAPLTCLSFQLTGKEHQELKVISQVSLESHTYNLGGNYTGLALLEHWSALLHLSQPDEQGDERVFRLLRHSLDNLDIGDGPGLRLQNLYFECWLLHFCGVLPLQKPNPGDNQKSGSRAYPEEEEDDAGLRRRLNPDFLSLVFQHSVGELVPDALKLGSLTETQRVLGQLWERFLMRELPTRALFLKRLDRRRHV